MKRLCLFIAILSVISFNYSIANANPLVAGGVGYLIGKSGQVATTNSPNAVMGVLPIKCWLDSDGWCGMGNGATPVEQMCFKITSQYKPVGFMYLESNSILILCAKPENKT